eukprot:tig00000893_g5347.t1
MAAEAAAFAAPPAAPGARTRPLAIGWYAPATSARPARAARKESELAFQALPQSTGAHQPRFEAKRSSFLCSSIARRALGALEDPSLRTRTSRAARCSHEEGDPEKPPSVEGLPEQITAAAQAAATAIFGKLQSQLDSYSAAEGEKRGADAQAGGSGVGGGKQPPLAWSPLGALPGLLDVTRWFRWASVGAGGVVGLVVAAAVLPIQKFLVLLAALAAAAAAAAFVRSHLRRRAHAKAAKTKAAPCEAAAAAKKAPAPPPPRAREERPREERAPRQAAAAEEAEGRTQEEAGGAGRGPGPVEEARAGDADAARAALRAAERAEAALEAGALRIVCFGEGGAPAAAAAAAALLGPGPGPGAPDAMRPLRLEGVRRELLVAASGGLGGDRAAEAAAREAAAAADLVLFPCASAPLPPPAARALRALAGGLGKRCLLVALPGAGREGGGAGGAAVGGARAAGRAVAAAEGPELLAENALYQCFRAARSARPRLAAARRRAATALVEAYQWRVAGGVAMAEEVAGAYGERLEAGRAQELAESVALTAGFLARAAGLALADYFEGGGWGEGGPEAALRRHLDLSGHERAVEEFVRQAWERVFLPALPAARDFPNPFASPRPPPQP